MLQKIFMIISCLILAICPIKGKDSPFEIWQNWVRDKSIITIQTKGRLPFEYIFNDSPNRNLVIRFKGKSSIEISNVVKTNPKLSFTDTYKIIFSNDYQNIMTIDRLVKTNRKDTITSETIPPFDYSLDCPNSCNSLFPILVAGTEIRADNHFGRLLIGVFYFNVKTYTDSEWKKLINILSTP